MKLFQKNCQRETSEYNIHEEIEKVKAQITHVDENGIFCKLANLRSARIAFSSDNNDVPRVGTFCLVKITRMNEENYQITCELIQKY